MKKVELRAHVPRGMPMQLVHAVLVWPVLGGGQHAMVMRRRAARAYAY
eukprot:SAG31_NODE_45284_length_259_cov_0.968750_1_plen_48_part_00